jgi:hypothetical protein
MCVLIGSLEEKLGVKAEDPPPTPRVAGEREYNSVRRACLTNSALRDIAYGAKRIPYACRIGKLVIFGDIYDTRTKREPGEVEEKSHHPIAVYIPQVCDEHREVRGTCDCVKTPCKIVIKYDVFHDYKYIGSMYDPDITTKILTALGVAQ